MVRTSLRASLALVCLVFVSACEQDEVYYGYFGPDRDAADGSGDAADDAGTDAADDITPTDTGSAADTTADIGGDDTAVADTGAPDAVEDTASDVPAEDTVSPDVTTDTAGGDGACDNGGDLAILAATEDIQAVMGDCGFACFTAGGTCAQECVQTETGLSTGCSACFGGAIDCTVSQCVFECITPDSPACASCIDEACMPAFIECAGVAAP